MQVTDTQGCNRETDQQDIHFKPRGPYQSRNPMTPPLSLLLCLRWFSGSCTEVDTKLTVSLAQTLIFSVCSQHKRPTNGWVQRSEWRPCGKVITRWCQAGAKRGFPTSSKGNEILIWFFFHFSFTMQPPSLPSCLLPDLLMLFLRSSA